MPSWVAPMVAAELWNVRWECVAAGISDGSIPTVNHCGMGFVDAACTASQRAAHHARRRLEHPNEPLGPCLTVTTPPVTMASSAIPPGDATPAAIAPESKILSVTAPSVIAAPADAPSIIAASDGRAFISPLTTDEDEAGPPPLEEDRGPDIRQWRTVRKNVSRTRIPPRRDHAVINPPNSNGFPSSDAPLPSHVPMPPPIDGGLAFPFT